MKTAMHESDPPTEGSIYRPIGEVAALLCLKTHVLRFWETKFKQIAPLKRSGGRRYYRREDVRLLFQIRDLLYVEGYTLRGAQKVLRARARPPNADKKTEQPQKNNQEENQGGDQGGDQGKDQGRDEEKNTPTAQLQPISDAVRADLRRITQRLEQTLATCSRKDAEGKTLDEHEQENEQDASEQEASEQATDRETTHEQATDKDASSGEQ